MGSYTDSGIYYETLGSGEAIVCISGLGGQASFWRAAAERLSARFRVISFDHPGVGRSAKPTDQRIPFIAQAALDVLDAQGVRTAHVLGHSTGSIVAQALAIDHRERCGSLVLSGGWAKADRRFRDLFDLRYLILEKLGTRAYSAFARLSGYDAQWYEQHIAAARLAFEGEDQFDVQTVLGRIEMLLDYERSEQLASLEIETLILGARDDFIVPFYHSEDLARRIGNATLVEFEGGHFFPQVDPDTFASHVTAFLKGSDI
jgi:aminoacrylate hydrolase